MFARNNLADNDAYIITTNNKPVKREHFLKVLGVTFHENLCWNNHVQTIIADCYSTLRTLRGIRRLTNFNTHKTLAETLILSKLDFSNVILKDCPSYLVKRMQKVQNATAGYVLGHYSNETDVKKLKWLSIKSRIDFNITKMAFKSLYLPTWPEYLTVERYEPSRDLRSNFRSEGLLKRNYQQKTFADQAALVFNELPKNIRTEESFNKFYTAAKKHFLTK